MKIAECSHIRIRDGNDYSMDVERLIKHLEVRYNIDFRSIPKWEALVHRMHLSITDCKRQIQASNRRKAEIVNKLYIEFCRPSPFELTETLARTAKIWKNRKPREPKKMSIEIPLEEVLPSAKNYYEGYEEALGEATPLHHNTEIVVSSDNVDVKLDSIISDVSPSHLPNFICNNHHKLVSPLGTSEESLKHIPNDKNNLFLSRPEKPKEWLVLDKTTRVKSYPKEITIEDTSLEEQIITFALVNCTTEYLNLRYVEVTEKEHFKRAKVLPVTPLKLFPGLAVTFKFVFKILQNVEEFTSQLYFRVGQKVLAKAPLEAFCLPIASKFISAEPIVTVTDVVTLPSTYFWRINARNGFPSSKMSIFANHAYDVFIRKHTLDLARSYENSIEAFSPDTESLLLKAEDEEIVNQSIISMNGAEEHVSIHVEDIVDLVIEDIIQQALDVFVFEKTFVKLEPFSKQLIKIYHAKYEYIGLHQSVYELEFIDPKTMETAFCKSVKVYGEALPNPIQVQPSLLDMNESPVTHGYCEDHITVINNHKIFPVTIKFKLTTKIKKLIRIYPMETFIPGGSRYDFTVRTCSKDLTAATREDLVHLTFIIIVIGDKSVYRGLPPIFYEIIVPCSFEFKKLYNNKFFDEFPEPSMQEIEVLMPPSQLLLNKLKSPKSATTPRAPVGSRAAVNN